MLRNDATAGTRPTFAGGLATVCFVHTAETDQFSALEEWVFDEWAEHTFNDPLSSDDCMHGRTDVAQVPLPYTLLLVTDVSLEAAVCCLATEKPRTLVWPKDDRGVRFGGGASASLPLHPDIQTLSLDCPSSSRYSSCAWSV